MDKLEASILDRSAFRGIRTSSPPRTASTVSLASSTSRSPSPSSASASSSQLPPRSSGPQTGPKGVLADNKYSLAIEKGRRREDSRKTRERLEKLALVGGTFEQQEKLARRERRLKEKLADLDERQGDLEDGGSEGEDLDEEENEVLRRYRARRLAELKGEAVGGSASTSDGKSSHRQKLEGWKEETLAAHFGHLRETDEKGYVRAVEGTGDGELEAKAVVVHIYSKLVPASNKLTAALTSLARLYPSTKFLQIRALSINFGLPTSSSSLSAPDSDSEDSDEDLLESTYRLRQLQKEESIADVLPTLLIYKQGNLLGNLVRVDLEDEWDDGSEKAVAALLKRYDAI